MAKIKVDTTALEKKLGTMNDKINAIKESIDDIDKEMQKVEKYWKCEPEPKTSTDSIDHKTARFIADAAALCSASVIIFEHPNRNGRK